MFDQRRISFSAMAWAIFSFAALLAPICSAEPAIPPSTFSPPQPVINTHSIYRRAEDVGSSCSSEGQWNCMTDSWQRCGSGQWSAVMDCAEGTVCRPSGLTDEFHVEHDGSVDGTSTSDGGQGGGNGGLSRGARGLLSSAGVVGVILVWTLRVVAF